MGRLVVAVDRHQYTAGREDGGIDQMGDERRPGFFSQAKGAKQIDKAQKDIHRAEQGGHAGVVGNLNPFSFMDDFIHKGKNGRKDQNGEQHFGEEGDFYAASAQQIVHLQALLFR